MLDSSGVYGILGGIPVLLWDLVVHDYPRVSLMPMNPFLVNSGASSLSRGMIWVLMER